MSSKMTPTCEQMLEALKSLNPNHFNTGECAYSKTIHTDDKHYYELLVHVNTNEHKLKMTTIIRKFRIIQEDERDFWFNQVYYKECELL